MGEIISKLGKVFLALVFCVFALLIFIIYKSPFIVFNIRYVYILSIGLAVIFGIIMWLCYYLECKYLDKLRDNELIKIIQQCDHEKEILQLRITQRAIEKKVENEKK